jgi:hypothetical protein
VLRATPLLITITEVKLALLNSSGIAQKFAARRRRIVDVVIVMAVFGELINFALAQCSRPQEVDREGGRVGWRSPPPPQSI